MTNKDLLDNFCMKCPHRETYEAMFDSVLNEYYCKKVEGFEQDQILLGDFVMPGDCPFRLEILMLDQK